MRVQPAVPLVDAHTLKRWVHDADELALLDVREHGQYGEGHLFFATSLPYSALELEAARLIPRKTVRTVIYGDAHGEAVVLAALASLNRLGYDDVHILQGGLQAWVAAGYACFAGVNLPSKTFGELVEHACGIPTISARALHDRLQEAATPIVVVDGRPAAEYRKMNIPGSVCCPNGELALRIDQIAPNPETTIVVNCAGRTRSIIGAQTLIRLGLPNPVLALENGTQGWFLDDFALEHDAARLYPDTVDDDDLPRLRARAARLCARLPGIDRVTAAQVAGWLDAGRHTVFVCDVRTKSEHLRDAVPGGVQHTPGGQLIQATDQYVGVRKARIVLVDTDGIRAPVVAYWLKQMGWDVSLLDDVRNLGERLQPVAYRPALKTAHVLAADALGAFLRTHPDALVLDARPSQEFRRLHLAGAVWVVRPQLSDRLRGRRGQAVVLLGTDSGRLQLLVEDLEAQAVAPVYWCQLEPGTLQDCGLPLLTNDQALPDAACIDYLFFVHDRHAGNKAAARQYLDWEKGLLAQIDARERGTFLLDASA